MALTQKSMFLYGFQITANNRSIDFRAVNAETPRQATLKLGYYSLTSLMAEIKRALEEADAQRIYTVAANRTIAGGMENRVTIATSGTYLQLLFSSGVRAASSVAPLIGFNAADYSGATSYTGSASAGTVLIPRHVGYNFLPPDLFREVFGTVNVSASGAKEAIVFNIQKFWQVEFRYETYADAVAKWSPFLDWCISQRRIEFTPEIGSPNVFYEGTLDKSEGSSNGLGYKLTEMLPQHPGKFKTGILTFRVKL